MITQTAMFPLDWIKQCISTYTVKHGKAPKLLVLAAQDYIEYKLNGTMPKHFDVTITYGDYLKRGEIDLADGVVYASR